MDTNQTILAVVIVIALSVGAYFLFIKKPEPSLQDQAKAAGTVMKGMLDGVKDVVNEANK